MELTRGRHTNAGQRDIRSIWPKYYAECHAVVFVIDSTDKERIEECWAVFGALTFLQLCFSGPRLTPAANPGTHAAQKRL